MLARHMDVYAEMDRFLDEQWQRNRRWGQLLFEVFKHDQGTGMTQVRNLQNMVVTATRFYDILDFIKNQMGKEAEPGRRDKSRRYWTRKVGDTLLGVGLIQELENLLDRAQRFAKSYPDSDPYYLALYLARGWIRQVMAEFLYQRALQED